MADRMTAFRRVNIDGPDYATDDPVWQASLDLGAQPNAGADRPPRNSSIRVILQSAHANNVGIEGQAGVNFQEPMLLALAATTVDFRKNPPSAPFVKIGRAQFTPFALADLASLTGAPATVAAPPPPSRYSDLRVAPKSAWPPRPEGFTKIDGVFELAAPRLRATRGSIPVVCALDAEPKNSTSDTRYPLTKLLSIEWATPGDYIRIFGGLFIRRRKTAKPIVGTKASDAITFDLTPDGIEFEVLVPDPFGTGTGASDRLPLRVRLVPIETSDGTSGGLQLDLIDEGRPPSGSGSLPKLKAGLTWMSRDLAERGGCISLQVSTAAVPRLTWPLQIKGNPASPVWLCDNPSAIPVADLVPSVRILEDAVAARLLTREEYGGGEPGVAELAGHRAVLSARRGNDPVVLTITSLAGQPAALEAIAPASPTVLLAWSEAAPPALNPDKIEVKTFSGIVDAAPLAARLGEVWSASGAIAAGTRPPYAFIALERGWVQMPLPPAPGADDPPPVKLLAAGSAFRGFLRLAIGADPAARADNPVLPGLEIVAAQSVSLTVIWKKPLDIALPRSIAATVKAAAGTLEGVLWAGEGSPSPTEILPPLDAGPAALTSVPISFGVSGPTNWQVKVAGFTEGGPGSISFSLPLPVSDPLLVWQPHPTLALVSSVSMTRTAESAKRPSATRELVPTEVIGGPTAPLALTFVANTAGAKARLPIIETLPMQTTAFGDGRWRWPWPPLRAAGFGPYPTPSSPEESAGVALASLTLPGIEFTPAADATTAVASSEMRVSLRYDLPVLDELFANSRAPEPKVPASTAGDAPGGSSDVPASPPRTDTPPTALDLVRLSGVWFENARRLARARTEADRVVLREFQNADNKQVVELWHPFTGIADGVVRGLAEPYVWQQVAFSFKALPPAPHDDVNLGAYLLNGITQYGPAALAGLPDTHFTATGNVLTVAGAPGPNQIEVKGFAASSFRVAFPPPVPPASPPPNHLQDARGLSLALIPDLTASRQTSRTVALRAAPDDQTLVLATLRKPVEVAIGSVRCMFWFRDLPLKPDGGGLTFDSSGGLETGLGPDPTAINRNRVARTLYEWSFFGPPETRPKQPDRGRFEFDLAGPLAARPLRLLSADVAADGSVLQFELLVSVQYKSPPSEADDVAPFAAEKIYASGNLVRLTFGPDLTGDNSLALKKMVRIELKDPSDPTAASDPFVPPAKTDPKPEQKPGPVSLISDVDVYHGPDATSSTSTTRLSFNFFFTRDVQASTPDIAAASLRARLFGQDCNLDTTDASFNPQGLTATFTAQPPPGGILNLRKMQLVWPPSGGPVLYLVDGDITVPLREAVDSPPAFKRNFADRTLQWLGLGSRPADGTESIDHETGLFTLDVSDRLSVPIDGQNASALFRGFALPAGTLRGAVVVVFPKRYAGEGQKWPTWPTPPLGSAFVEFAFDADAKKSPQRITAIRHRHTGSSGPVTWDSQLLLDAAFHADGLNTSSISWPVGYAKSSHVTFDADPSVPGNWPATLTMRGSADPMEKLLLTHSVRPRLCSHELPTDNLVVDKVSGAVVLDSSWSFRAVVDHTLTPAKGVWPGAPATSAKSELTWTAVDEVIMFDMHRLVAAANLAPDPARDRYAFLARYKETAADSDIRIAGVVRRALADAGFPVEYIMQALKGTTAPDSLVLTGAALTEVVTSLETPNKGVVLIPQWILPWAPLTSATGGDPRGETALGALKACPQTQSDGSEVAYNIALYDTTAGTPHSLEGAPPYSLAAQDGTQRLLETRMSSIVGGGKARTMVAVDQVLIVQKPTAPPPLHRPLFPRTLLALGAVAEAFGKTLNGPAAAPFAQRISCVTARAVPLDGTRAAGEIRFAVTAWPANAAPLDPAPPAVTLIVTDESSVQSDILPAALAATLVDSTSNWIVADGKQRADASMRAFGKSADPRALILASVDSSYLTIRDPQSPLVPPPHVSWLVTPALALMAERRPHVLRKISDTIYASPALGWPLIPRPDEAAKAHASLGKEEVRRNEQQAWAGRARGMAWPAVAWDRKTGIAATAQGTIEGNYSPSDAAEMRDSAFITAGQRIAFRRRAAKNLRAPADRLSVLAPPRARAPTIDAMAAAFSQARNPLPDDGQPGDRAGLAPMLPGAIETTVTGQRPGALLTQFEGVLLTSFMVPFDKDFSRFGRPAWRGPLTLRQVRAPRSSALPEIPDLAIRRKTYLSMDEVDDAKHLKTFKIIEGPAQVVRFDRTPTADTRSPHAVTIRVQDPDQGRLSADWHGKIRLIATVPGDLPDPDPAAHVALARIGVLPSPANQLPSQTETRRPRAELRVGDVVVIFTQMAWGENIDAPPTHPNPKPKRLMIDLTFEKGATRDAAQVAMAQALRNASANTPVQITFRGTRPSVTDAHDPTIDVAGTTQLETGNTHPLLPGPPPVLVFDLPHAPSRQRWLPIKTFTLAFGDPAYDRELGSPANSNQVGIDDVPHVLAVDRAEYDPASTIFLAFWKRAKGLDTKPEKPTDPWALSVQLVPGNGGPRRQLQIAATIPSTASSDPRYALDGYEAYAIPLSALRELADPKSPAADVPAQLKAGDRVRLTVTNVAHDNQQLTLDVGIIAQPVLPPPASTYGLATLQRIDAAVGTALFATAPLPQAIEFPNLLDDLVAGHVRRRGLFLWPFTGNGGSGADPDHAFGFLVKIDRTGGGQLPAAKSDFQKSES